MSNYLLVAKALKTACGPISSQEIFSEAKKHNRSLSIECVYKLLGKMTKKGKVEKFEQGKECFYTWKSAKPISISDDKKSNETSLDNSGELQHQGIDGQGIHNKRDGVAVRKGKPKRGNLQPGPKR
jgi:Fe2+ or Zn2+ uptake regulation protein